MKILVLGDLHSRQDWFSWLAQRIPEFDLIAIPGDMLDIFQPDIESQKQFVIDWFSLEIDRGKPLAWCSGNHDMTRWSFMYPNLKPCACWTDQIRFDSVVGDSETKVFISTDGESFLVTCLPYCELQSDAWISAMERILEDGSEERRRRGCSWMVLSHEPPSAAATATTESGILGSDLFGRWIRRFQPDLVFSGHFHQAPFIAQFWDRLDRTFCVNAGHVANASFPSHIVIDTGTGKAMFRYERGTGEKMEIVCSL